ncbi:MAG: tRNA (N6-threonylcarbamoyladenosine(37)-N6)-methyltransferase TrmO [Paracoccaceae bacterium]|nr:tRNA (N6-threonylcarbamoyladenosine(37)-N6)-methyltransferase TrmO [Paracoccaceae bacterium]
MTHHGDALRPGETVLDRPLAADDAGLVFIGVLRTPFQIRDDCPRQGSFDGPECRVELRPEFAPALQGIERHSHLELLYWLHRARRDLLSQSPKADGEVRGTFSLRSPLRPNPIGTSVVKLERREGNTLIVRGLDCLDGTPLLDVKPDRCGYTVQARAKGLD